MMRGSAKLFYSSNKADPAGFILTQWEGIWEAKDGGRHWKN
jgi:hypothetical protein